MPTQEIVRPGPRSTCTGLQQLARMAVFTAKVFAQAVSVYVDCHTACHKHSTLTSSLHKVRAPACFVLPVLASTSVVVHAVLTCIPVLKGHPPASGVTAQMTLQGTGVPSRTPTTSSPGRKWSLQWLSMREHSSSRREVAKCTVRTTGSSKASGNCQCKGRRQNVSEDKAAMRSRPSRVAGHIAPYVEATGLHWLPWIHTCKDTEAQMPSKCRPPGMQRCWHFTQQPSLLQAVLEGSRHNLERKLSLEQIQPFKHFSI